MIAKGARIIMAATLLATMAVDGAGARADPARPAHSAATLNIASGAYLIRFDRKKGAIDILRGKVGLALHELPGGKRLNLLSSVRSIHRSSGNWELSGSTHWAKFTIKIVIPAAEPGMLGITVQVTPRRDVPSSNSLPDVRLLHSSARALTEYAAGPPMAGTSIYLADRAMGSTILYFSDYTTLGRYFERTNSGPTQANFPYQGAGDKGSLVGVTGAGFGYVPPPSSLQSLPRGKTTTVVHSFLYLQPSLPADEAAESDTYLRMLDTVYARLPKPSLPAADWHAYAIKAAQELDKPANLVTVAGHQYLKSYVSDTRVAPELITQAAVLAGLRAYERRYGVTVPLDATLDQDLPTFYDPIYHTVTNGLPHDPRATGESWYFVDNLISLLQLAQGGDQTARQLLLNSVDALITLAHTTNYTFPVSFRYGVWKGGQGALEPDVAGGYAWLMLGLYDLTDNTRYLGEAEASIKHVAGRGFDLSYETHMTAYTAAAAQRLYRLTGEPAYHGYALLALANLFHATRLWDCTYGACNKGGGYHTYMGINPLPWSDYVAMLEQYEAWLGMRDYLRYAGGEPSYVTNLAQAFVAYSPLTLQYSLPPRLPRGAATTAAGTYSFVPHNVLTWYVPIEDLREGEAISGTIGQEIYGAGGVFVFAALQSGIVPERQSPNR